MKKHSIFILLALNTLVSFTIQGQGFLGKLKEGVESLGSLGGVSSKVSAKDLKKAEEDAIDPTLDSKPFTKDRYGFGGIYYAKEVMYGINESNNLAIPLKKFLVDFDEKKLKMTVSNRFSFIGDNTKKIEPIIAGADEDLNASRIGFTISTAIKEPAVEIRIGQDRFGYHTYTKEGDGSGKSIRSKNKSFQKLRTMGTSIIMMESGILIVRQKEFYGGIVDLKKGAFRKEESEYQQAKIQTAMVLYRADKKEKAEALTEEQINDFMENHCLKYHIRYSKNLDGQKEFQANIENAIAQQRAEATANGSNESSSTSSSSNTKIGSSITITLVNKSDNKVEITGKITTSVNGRTTKTIRLSNKGTIAASSGWRLDVNDSHEGQKFIIAQ
jgi:hypothetical protein